MQIIEKPMEKPLQSSTEVTKQDEPVLNNESESQSRDQSWLIKSQGRLLYSVILILKYLLGLRYMFNFFEAVFLV